MVKTRYDDQNFLLQRFTLVVVEPSKTTSISQENMEQNQTINSKRPVEGNLPLIDRCLVAQVINQDSSTG